MVMHRVKLMNEMGSWESGVVLYLHCLERFWTCLVGVCWGFGLEERVVLLLCQPLPFLHFVRVLVILFCCF